MTFMLFYSWQTDLPPHCNKDFIREAINEAAKDAEVVDSPRIDSGMEGISGTPEVASIMFEKIDRCAIFIGDVSLVGTIPANHGAKEEKRVPNPNVSLEMGYAAARIGWDRVICVMNEAFGHRLQQPFDVRNRRFPIDYRLSPDASNKRAEVQRDLVKWLKTAITSAEQNEFRRVDDAIERLDSQCLDVLMNCGGQAYFHIPEPRTGGQHLDALFLSNAIGRLLELRLLRCEQYPDHPHDSPIRKIMWAYHWTHLGKNVLKHLEISDPDDQRSEHENAKDHS